MKRVLLFITHLGAQSDTLYEILNANPRIQMATTHTIYRTPMDAVQLTTTDHKLRTTAAIYGDRVLYNHTFCCDQLCKHCKFVYLIRAAKPTLSALLATGDYTPTSALRYYQFRLRRIMEMGKRTPGAVLLTHDGVEKEGLGLIEEYLNLKTPLQGKSLPQEELEEVPSEVVEIAQDSYERYLYQLKNMDLLVL